MSACGRSDQQYSGGINYDLLNIWSIRDSGWRILRTWYMAQNLSQYCCCYCRYEVSCDLLDEFANYLIGCLHSSKKIVRIHMWTGVSRCYVVLHISSLFWWLLYVDVMCRSGGTFLCSPHRLIFAFEDAWFSSIDMGGPRIWHGSILTGANGPSAQIFGSTCPHWGPYFGYPVYARNIMPHYANTHWSEQTTRAGYHKTATLGNML